MKWAIIGLLLVVAPSFAADVYWYPGDTPDFSGMVAGDTFYVCGEHNDFPNNFLTVTVSDITVSGDCVGNIGSIVGGYTVIKNADNVIVEKLALIGDKWASMGIDLQNTEGSIIRDNMISDMAGGIRALKPDYANNITIERNTIEDSAQGLMLWAYTGQESSIKKDWQIRNNVLRNIQPRPDRQSMDYEAIGAQGAKNLTISGNVIVNARYGINVWACDTAILEGVDIHNNFLTDINGGPASWPSRGIFKSCSASDGHKIVTIYDNVVHNVEGAGIRWHATVTNPIPVTIMDNIVWDTGGIEFSGNVLLIDNVEN